MISQIYEKNKVESDELSTHQSMNTQCSYGVCVCVCAGAQYK